MRNLLTASVIFALQFAFCSDALADPAQDLQLKTKLVGQWQELRDLGSEKHQQVMTLRGNGTFEVKGIIRSCDEETVFVWRGKWRVKDSRFWYKTTYSFPKDLFPKGEELSDKIISVSSVEWVMKEESTGKQSHAFRVK